jgi:hypothetical protein
MLPFSFSIGKSQKKYDVSGSQRQTGCQVVAFPAAEEQSFPFVEAA